MVGVITSHRTVGVVTSHSTVGVVTSHITLPDGFLNEVLQACQFVDEESRISYEIGVTARLQRTQRQKNLIKIGLWNEKRMRR